MKRIATYCFYDPKGEVARHKVYYLSQLVKFVDRLVIVCNGELTVEGRDILEQFTEDVIVRENEGFDFWAHKTGLEYIGWDNLVEYDNYLLCNDTCYGPIFPFDEMFEEMDKRDCDFWGAVLNTGDENVAEHGGIPFPEGYVKAFLSGVFININSRILKSYEFKRFWDALEDISNYSEAFIYGEYNLTYYFRKCGFKYDSYHDSKAFMKRYITAITGKIPYHLLKDHKIPLLRKKAVNGALSLSDFWILSYGEEAHKALEYIEGHTDYDVSMIWEDILRDNHLSDIQERLQLEYIVPENHLEREYTYNKKIAVICHIYYDDLVEECATYSENFPEGTDFYLTTTSEETMAEIHKEYGKRGFSYQVQIIPNQGRDAPALFVAYAHIVTNGDYEYICYFHDKKSAHKYYKEIGVQFKLRCYNALFGTKNTVRNIINKFESNSCLGLVANSPPYHNEYFASVPSTWEKNYDGIKKIIERIDLDIPLSENRAAPSAHGAMFWFRAVALKKMLSNKFTHDVFSDASSEKTDGTISHAIERIYGLAVQDSGYYMAHVLSDGQARCDIANYQAMLFGNDGIAPLVYKYIPRRGGYPVFMNDLRDYFQETRILDLELQEQLCTHVKLGSDSQSQLCDRINAQDYLETISTRLLFKKFVKRLIPRFIWNPIANRRQKKISMRENGVL